MEKRKVGTEDRAWTVEEVKAGMEVAKNMGRTDVYHAIGIGYAFGLRVRNLPSKIGRCGESANER